MKTVFTNGCFDIVHPGHVDLLKRARALGDRLVVGINSDASVASIKGVGRPFMDQDSRKAVLLGLESVDEVLIFDELTPARLVESIKPDVLVKGGDWRVGEIVGSESVLKNGGEVISLPLLSNFSSTRIVEKVRGETSSDNSPNDVPNELKSAVSTVGQMLTNLRAKGSGIKIISDTSSSAEAEYYAQLLSEAGLDHVGAQTSPADTDLVLAVAVEADPKDLLASLMSFGESGITTISLVSQAAKKISSVSKVSLMASTGSIPLTRLIHLTVVQEWVATLKSSVSND